MCVIRPWIDQYIRSVDTHQETALAVTSDFLNRRIPSKMTGSAAGMRNLTGEEICVVRRGKADL